VYINCVLSVFCPQNNNNNNRFRRSDQILYKHLLVFIAARTLNSGRDAGCMGLEVDGDGLKTETLFEIIVNTGPVSR